MSVDAIVSFASLKLQNALLNNEFCGARPDVGYVEPSHRAAAAILFSPCRSCLPNAIFHHALKIRCHNGPELTS